MNPITAAALGAGLMYLFDPEQGETRRAKIQDKCAGLASQSKAEFDLSVRDLQHRAEDCVADMRSGIAEKDPSHAIQHLREELTQWTPATRLLATAGGGALAACVLGAIAPRTLMLAGLGAGVCAAVMNRERLEEMAAETMIEAGAEKDAVEDEGAEQEIKEPIRAARK